MYIVCDSGAYDNCHIHYMPYSVIVIACNVFKRSYTQFVNSEAAAVHRRYARRGHSDVYTTISDHSPGNRLHRHFTFCI